MEVINDEWVEKLNPYMSGQFSQPRLQHGLLRFQLLQLISFISQLNQGAAPQISLPIDMLKAVRNILRLVHSGSGVDSAGYVFQLGDVNLFPISST
jgi:hypothetical protein